jgi:hypothetical protein
VKKEPNREAWLREAYALIRKELLPEAPETVAVTWGFPSKNATSRRKRTVGQCFGGNSVRGKIEGGRAILVSPVIEKPLEVLDTLLHEMIHAALPPDVGHRAPFSQLCKRVGLVKPWTATTPSKELKEKLEGYLKKLDPWPVGHLFVVPKEKGRQMKAECECGRILRCARKTFEAGPILCGMCEGEFEMEGG